jgi:hypothetical protein
MYCVRLLILLISDDANAFTVKEKIKIRHVKKNILFFKKSPSFNIINLKVAHNYE